jgi:phage-related protein
MSSIINALSDLVSSMVELVWSFFTTALHLVENTAQFAAKFATEIVELVINFFKGLVDLAGGIVSFLVGKFSMLKKSLSKLTTVQATSLCSQSWLPHSSASSSTSAARVVPSRLETRNSTKSFPASTRRVTGWRMACYRVSVSIQ